MSCPNCGYCEKCGRSNFTPAPYQPTPWRPWPTYPYWYSTTPVPMGQIWDITYTGGTT